MWLQAVDHPGVVSLQPVDDDFALLVPEEDVAAVAAAHHKLRLGAEKVDALDRFDVAES